MGRRVWGGHSPWGYRKSNMAEVTENTHPVFYVFIKFKTDDLFRSFNYKHKTIQEKVTSL